MKTKLVLHKYMLNLMLQNPCVMSSIKTRKFGSNNKYIHLVKFVTNII